MTLQQPASPQRCAIPPSCTIVPAEVDDLETICRFDGPMLRDFRQRDFVASAIEEGRCWVAFFDETPVAYGIFNYQFQGYGVIHRVYVSPPYRRRGIGRAVIDYFCEACSSPRHEFELTSAVDQLIAAGHRLEIFPIEGAWRDIGRPEDLAAATEEMT